MHKRKRILEDRCIIARCPWKGKYSFGLKNYSECWFHGGDVLWLLHLWNLLFLPATWFYRYMYYRVCEGIKYGGFNLLRWYKHTWKDMVDDYVQA